MKKNAALAKTTDTMVKELGLLHGFAYGNYLCKCDKCKQDYWGEKRSYTCLPCAVNAHYDAGVIAGQLIEAQK